MTAAWLWILLSHEKVAFILGALKIFAREKLDQRQLADSRRS